MQGHVAGAGGNACTTAMRMRAGGRWCMRMPLRNCMYILRAHEHVWPGTRACAYDSAAEAHMQMMMDMSADTPTGHSQRRVHARRALDPPPTHLVAVSLGNIPQADFLGARGHIQHRRGWSGLQPQGLRWGHGRCHCLYRSTCWVHPGGCPHLRIGGSLIQHGHACVHADTVHELIPTSMWKHCLGCGS